MIYGRIAIKGEAGPEWIKADDQHPGTVDVYFGETKNGGDFSIMLDRKAFLALIELGREYLAAGKGFAQGTTNAEVVVLPDFSVNMEADAMKIEPCLDGIVDGVSPYFTIRSKQGHVSLVPTFAQIKALRDCCQNLLDASQALKKAGRPIKVEVVAKPARAEARA